MRYEHDCDKCMPLGGWNEYDLYYCRQDMSTVIARYGPDADYHSGALLAPHIPALAAAVAMAKAKGYL